MTRIRRTAKGKAGAGEAATESAAHRPATPPVTAAKTGPKPAQAQKKSARTARTEASTRGSAAEKLRIFTPAGGGARPEGQHTASQNQHRAPQNQAPRGKRRAQQQTDTPPPTRLRLFYALKVPVNVANPLAERQRQLRGNWRAVRPDQMHVTLTYLPGVPPERLPDLVRLGARLTEHLPPMQVTLRGTGYFPNEGSPRVWFVKVEAEGLDRLAADLRAGVQALGLDTEELPFKAHITLARKKGPAPRVPPLTFDLGWQASAVTLQRSILRKTGPIYETESTFRLRGTPPAPDAPTATDPQEQST